MCPEIHLYAIPKQVTGIRSQNDIIEGLLINDMRLSNQINSIRLRYHQNLRRNSSESACRAVPICANNAVSARVALYDEQ